MPTEALYDRVADWYEYEFLEQSRGLDGHPLGIDHALATLLGPGSGVCLEIGCGTGEWAGAVRSLGRKPVGVDLSMGMLRHASDRLPIARADAEHLPIASGALDAAVTVMTNTDMPGYPKVLREAARVLRTGGVFVHVGVHPCFCGGFADRSDPAAVVVRAGYLDGEWTTDSWTDQGLRDKVGAAHWPLPRLLGMFGDAGFDLDRFAEGGAPVPTVLAIRARNGRTRAG
ncbi:MAG: class I SAM-dependent methyltransferase [Jatrophihabitantaceae bacterium]